LIQLSDFYCFNWHSLEVNTVSNLPIAPESFFFNEDKDCTCCFLSPVDSQLTGCAISGQIWPPSPRLQQISELKLEDMGSKEGDKREIFYNFTA
jgi:hypothetical protein